MNPLNSMTTQPLAMSNRFELAALLNRAAAAIETPGDLTADELRHIVEDLCIEADNLDPVANP